MRKINFHFTFVFTSIYDHPPPFYQLSSIIYSDVFLGKVSVASASTLVKTGKVARRIAKKRKEELDHAWSEGEGK